MNFRKTTVKVQLEEIKDLPQEQISNLLKIIRIFKDSVMKQRKEDLELEKGLRE